jgi:hypothetical protein
MSQLIENIPLILGAPCFPETLNQEYKSFCFVDLESSEIHEMTTSFQNGIIPDSLVQHGIASFIHKYISKYISNFANAGINGQLICGVDDSLCVTGIPTPFPLDEIKVFEMIRKELLVTLRTSHTNSEVEQCLDVKCEKLSIDTDLLPDDNLDDFIETYERETLLQNDIRSKYKTDFVSWYFKISFYKQKLVEVVNIPRFRRELIIFIQNNISKYTIELQIEINKIIVLLQSSKILNISRTIKTEELSLYQSDPTSYLYWTMLFRDFKTVELLREKPDKLVRCEYIPNMDIALSKHVNFAHRFIRAGIDYYVIIITIKGSLLIQKDFSYLQRGEWTYKKRANLNSGPGCI